MPATIVIGFDGTDSGEDALALGTLLARATGAEFREVSVPRGGGPGA